MLLGFARGFAAGCAWGVLARVFMRVLATNPQFTWAGTLVIVGMSGLFWGGIGLVGVARRRGRSPWWRAAPIPGLVLFASPGMVLLPGAVGVAIATSVRNPAVRVGAVLVGLTATVYPVVGVGGEAGGGTAPTAWTGVGLLVVATAWLGMGLRAWWRPWKPAPAHDQPEAMIARAG